MLRNALRHHGVVYGDDMQLRRCIAGLLRVVESFHRVRDHKQIHMLDDALDRFHKPHDPKEICLKSSLWRNRQFQLTKG